MVQSLVGLAVRGNASGTGAALENSSFLRWILSPRRRLILRIFASTLSATALLAVTRTLYKLCLAFRRRALNRYLHFASPLAGTTVKQACPSDISSKGSWLWSWSPTHWQGFCPCCKRPIDAYLAPRWDPPLPAPEARGKYAFVICIWGTSPEYVIGAMVLGYSIKQTSSPHDRVCCYTADVPRTALELLSKLWICRPIEHIEAATEALAFSDTPDRFKHVFSKLNVLCLTEYEKVLLMDIDLLVRANVDELFKLSPPAAMRRGMGEFRPRSTGEEVDGRFFFLGKEENKWSWGQGTGINAGVMLLRPDRKVFDEMLREISDPNHPEHVQGNGPEQDYLSRFWADAPWTHLGAEYNYQMHQMYYALHPDKVHTCHRARLLAMPEQIKIVHYSGVSSAKPWHRVLDDRWRDFWPDRSRDAEYTDLFANEFQGHWLWVKRDRSKFEAVAGKKDNWDMEGMYLDEKGLLRRSSTWNNTQDNPELLEIPEFASKGATEFLGMALQEWFDALQGLEEGLGVNIKETIMASARHTKPMQFVETASDSGSDTDGIHKWNKINSIKGRIPGVVENLLPSRSLNQPLQSSRQAGMYWQWHRDGGQDGWWTECSAAIRVGAASEAITAHKVSVACGALPERGFVTFVERGQDVFEINDMDVCGVFIKVVGQNSARRFSVPRAITCEAGLTSNDLKETLASISLWVAGVPHGEVILLAMVCIDSFALKCVLQALEPLGIPQVPPREFCAALAAIGGAGASGKWMTHAATDIAFVTAALRA